MTVEEFIKTHTFKNGDVKTGYIGMNQSALEEALKSFTEHKCKELLEIVAEKAKIKNIHTDETSKLYCLDGGYDLEVDKDSILNAVDLKEFIK